MKPKTKLQTINKTINNVSIGKETIEHGKNVKIIENSYDILKGGGLI